MSKTVRLQLPGKKRREQPTRKIARAVPVHEYYQEPEHLVDASFEPAIPQPEPILKRRRQEAAAYFAAAPQYEPSQASPPPAYEAPPAYAEAPSYYTPEPTSAYYPTPPTPEHSYYAPPTYPQPAQTAQAQPPGPPPVAYDPYTPLSSYPTPPSLLTYEEAAPVAQNRPAAQTAPPAAQTYSNAYVTAETPPYATPYPPAEPAQASAPPTWHTSYQPFPPVAEPSFPSQPGWPIYEESAPQSFLPPQPTPAAAPPYPPQANWAVYPEPQPATPPESAWPNYDHTAPLTPQTTWPPAYEKQTRTLEPTPSPTAQQTPLPQQYPSQPEQQLPPLSKPYEESTVQAPSAAWPNIDSGPITPDLEEPAASPAASPHSTAWAQKAVFAAFGEEPESPTLFEQAQPTLITEYQPEPEALTPAPAPSTPKYRIVAISTKPEPHPNSAIVIPLEREMAQRQQAKAEAETRSRAEGPGQTASSGRLPQNQATRKQPQPAVRRTPAEQPQLKTPPEAPPKPRQPAAAMVAGLVKEQPRGRRYQNPLKVTLLAYTPEPEKVVAAAARLCYSPQSGADLMENLTEEKTQEFLSRLSAQGHFSPFEHATFTFAVDGVSRSLSHQLVRHRIASYSQKSQRYVKERGFQYVIPPSIVDKPEQLAAFTNLMQQIEQQYSDFLAAGIPAEDARAVLPNATATNLVITMNARSLHNFFRLRCCRRAQAEIRKVANLMLTKVKQVAPSLFMDAGPSCLTEGVCYESKMSCGFMNVPVRKGRA